MSIKHVFKSSNTSPHNMINPKGKVLPFVDGRHVTNNEYDIAYLTTEANSEDDPYVYIDPNEPTIDTAFQEELEEAKAEAVRRVSAKFGINPGATSTSQANQVGQGIPVITKEGQPSIILTSLDDGQSSVARIFGEQSATIQPQTPMPAASSQPTVNTQNIMAKPAEAIGAKATQLIATSSTLAALASKVKEAAADNASTTADAAANATNGNRKPE